MPTALLVSVMVILFIIWSNSFHAISYFRRQLGTGALELVILRYGPVAPFCLAWCLFRWRDLRALTARDGWRIALMGLTMVPAYNLALNWGQGRVPPATASLIITMNPVFTFLLAVLFLKERPRSIRFLGLALAFLGVYLLVRAQYRSFGSGYAFSALVVLLAPLSWAVATVTGKPATTRTDPLLVSFAATGLGSLPFFVMLLAGSAGVHPLIASLPRLGWIAWIHLSVLCTLVGFTIWFWALRHWTASAVSAFVFLNPPLTSFFGVLFGTEAFHWRTAVFGSVTLAGVALSAGLLRWPRGASTRVAESNFTDH